MKQYELETGTIGFLELPSDAYDIEFEYGFVFAKLPCLEGWKEWHQDIRQGNWQPLSLFSQLKEEDVKEVMPKITTGHFYAGNYVEWFLYKCFDSGEFNLEFGIGSLHSLAQHLELDTTQPIFVIFKPKQECKCTDEQSWNCIECIKPR